jgi:hypothetical protein
LSDEVRSIGEMLQTKRRPSPIEAAEALSIQNARAIPPLVTLSRTAFAELDLAVRQALGRLG